MPFDRDVWEGRKPLVVPMELRLEAGAVVWTKTAEQRQRERNGEDAGVDDAPRQGGIVVRWGVDEATGERWADVLDARMRGQRFEVFVQRFTESELDPTACEPPTAGKRHRAARQINRALGEKLGAKLVGFDFELFLIALGLVYDDGQAATGRQVA